MTWREKWFVIPHFYPSIFNFFLGNLSDLMFIKLLYNNNKLVIYTVIICLAKPNILSFCFIIQTRQLAENILAWKPLIFLSIFDIFMTSCLHKY